MDEVQTIIFKRAQRILDSAPEIQCAYGDTIEICRDSVIITIDGGDFSVEFKLVASEINGKPI